MIMKNYSARRTLVVGTGPLVGELLEEIKRSPRCYYRVEGVIVEPSFAGDSFHDCAVLGSVKQLNRILQEHEPEVIIVAHSRGPVALFEHQLL